MTLKEVIESGKPFKRPLWNKFSKAIQNPNEGVPVWCNADVVATDWEIESKLVRLEVRNDISIQEYLREVNEKLNQLVDVVNDLNK